MKVASKREQNTRCKPDNGLTMLVPARTMPWGRAYSRGRASSARSGRDRSWRNCATSVGAAAADVLLDEVDRSDALQRLVRDRSDVGDGELVEPTPQVRPTEGEPEVAFIGKRATGDEAVDLAIMES